MKTSRVVYIPRFTGTEWVPWQTVRPTPEQFDKWNSHPRLDYNNIFTDVNSCQTFIDTTYNIPNAKN